MENKFTVTIKSIRVSYLFSSALLLTLSGCINPPVLLRNRPDVPPPVIEPTDAESMNGNQIMSVGNTGNIGTVEETPIQIITIPKALPVPDIKSAPITYTVQKGDSFWKVARMYGVTQSELATCNNLSLKKPLRAGTVLLIPPGGEFIPADKRPKLKKRTAPVRRPAPVKTAHAPAKVNAPAKKYVPSLKDGKYTVQAGDNAWKIARRFHVTTSLLMQANNLNSKSILHVGQTLIIPGAGDTAKTYTAPHVRPPATPKKTSTGIIKNTSTESEADKLLNDAEDAATGKAPVAPLDTTPGDDVLNGDGLDAAVKITETETPGSLYTEEVLPNETLQDIADRHGMTPEEIIAVNPGLSADGKLKPFTSIKIPNK